MKAILYKKYGAPEVVSLSEAPMPVPKQDELLVKVVASTVNRTDSSFRSAKHFMSRLASGLLRPRYPILGCEFAGVVERTGEAVQLFKEGDRVFGYNDDSFGCHAEYLIIGEREAVAHIPDKLTFTEAAPLTEGAHYALSIVRASRVKGGDHALVYGATGAIGSAAVQLLKYLNVKVTAVCNTKNVPLLYSLGADKVVDYQTEDFTQTEDRFHLIFDAVGKSSYSQCKPLLIKKGIYASTELGRNGANVFLALFTPLLFGKKVIFPIPTIHRGDVLFLKQLAEEGLFKPVVDREYTMDQIVEAYQYVDSGQKTGSVILHISASTP